MLRDKIFICGAFDFKGMSTGGQPVKTRELYFALCAAIGKEKIIFLDTVGWKKNPINLIMQFFFNAYKSRSVIMLPAHNGVIVFSRLLTIAKKVFGCKIYYDVIGGWLPDKLRANNMLLNQLKFFNSIWVETNVMKNTLNNLGLANIEVVRNFKRLTPIPVSEIGKKYSSELRMCLFSRVMKEKGVEDAIHAVEEINSSTNHRVILDIYGQVDDRYFETFNELKGNFPKEIKYCGVVNPSDSVGILKNYDLLLFPTLYLTEGLPGTIIDAYAAGLPVIASRWNSFSDIVDENKTGLGFELGNYRELVDCILWASSHRDQLSTMRLNCIMKAKEFLPETVINQLIEMGGI